RRPPCDSPTCHLICSSFLPGRPPRGPADPSGGTFGCLRANLSVTLRCSTELRIDARKAEQSRITGLAFSHSLRVAACDFQVGLRGSLDELGFIEYVGNSDVPLFTRSIHESRERAQNWKNNPVRHFRSLAIFSLEQGEPRSAETRMRLPSFIEFPGPASD